MPSLRRMNARDFIAKSMTKFFRFFADTFFRDRYGQRALILETVAGVPGMVGGMLTHLKSLRRMERGNGSKIHTLLEEAENERKHLMFMMEVVHPTIFERTIVIIAQFLFWHYYLVMYLLFPSLAHKMVAYFEEEAVRSYTEYLELIRTGKIENVPAPQIAIEYYGMHHNATLFDMITYIRRDEINHANVNHRYADN